MEKVSKEFRSIIDATEKKEEKNIQALTMMKVMVKSIESFILKEAESNASFKESTRLEWKSAERCLKYVWGKARSLAVQTSVGVGCCVPDDIVFDWVVEYYALDDKKIVEKEKAKAEAEKKKAEDDAKIRAEAEEKARQKALEKFSSEEGWNDLSEEEREKKVTMEVKTTWYKFTPSKK